MNQFRSNIQSFRVSTFWMSGNMTDFRWRQPAGAKYVICNTCPPHARLITAPKTRKTYLKILVLARWGHYTRICRILLDMLEDEPPYQRQASTLAWLASVKLAPMRFALLGSLYKRRRKYLFNVFV